MRAEEIRDLWCEGAARGDAAVLGELMADDVVLVSPLTNQFVFRGREEVVQLLNEVFKILTDVTFSRRLVEDDLVMLVVEAKVKGRDVHEVAMLELGAEGLIARCTFFMRPLPALSMLMRELGSNVPAARGQKGLAATMKVMGMVPDLIISSSDSSVMPMVKPFSAK